MSMRAALDELARTAAGRRVAVLGDMLELGAREERRYHRELGKQAQAAGVELLVTVGGARAEVANRVDFRDCQVVENEQYASGCSSSIGAAIGVVDDRAEGVILLLGDQPDVTTGAVRKLIEGAAASPLGVCRYGDGLGHPFWFRRQVFDDLLALHGDKAVWKLLESDRYPVREVVIDGNLIGVDIRQAHAELAQRARRLWT